MRAYADSSFIVRLVTTEPQSQAAIDEFRRLGRPRLFYLPLHALEAENAIYQRAFHQKKSVASGERSHIKRERDAALSRIGHLRRQTTLVDLTLEMDVALERARKMASAHTERLGARAIDLLHVACAALLKAEFFLSFDERQIDLAKIEGMKVLAPR